MKNKNLRQKISLGVAGLGLAGVLGCETPEQERAVLLTLVGAGLQNKAMTAETLRQAAAASALSQGAYALGQQQAQLDAAKQGRSEVNVNVNQTSQEKKYEEEEAERGKDHEYVLMMLNKKESKWEIVATDYNSIINLFGYVSDTSEKGVYPVLIGVKNRNSKDYGDLSRMNLYIEEDNITIKDMNNEPLYIRPIKK